MEEALLLDFQMVEFLRTCEFFLLGDLGSLSKSPTPKHPGAKHEGSTLDTTITANAAFFNRRLESGSCVLRLPPPSDLKPQGRNTRF